MLRSHEFDKVEILSFATPEQAPDLLVDMTGRAERAIAGLGLPYRIIEICTGDLGQSHHRSFDIEVYAPGADTWLEVSSISWFSDYQARRGNIRFRRHDAEGKPLKGTEFVHTLNGSALAVPRVWAAIIENYRNDDGSVDRARGAAAVHARHHPHRSDRLDRHERPRSSRASRPGPTCSATAGCSTRRPGSTSTTSTPDPVEQWRRWHDQALDAGVAEPNAMTVATIGADGVPDARIVLARGADERGLVFYTNYEGAKSRQLDAAPVAAAVFSWLDLHRQVRLRARVERVSAEESDAYFASRPRGSQLGAWASPQSDVIADRSLLDDRVARFDTQFADVEVPRPSNWGGWRLIPFEWEFWQGRPSRLHDRLRYRSLGDPPAWHIDRLAP